MAAAVPLRHNAQIDIRSPVTCCSRRLKRPYFMNRIRQQIPESRPRLQPAPARLTLLALHLVARSKQAHFGQRLLVTALPPAQACLGQQKHARTVDAADVPFALSLSPSSCRHLLLIPDMDPADASKFARAGCQQHQTHVSGAHFNQTAVHARQRALWCGGYGVFPTPS